MCRLDAEVGGGCSAIAQPPVEASIPVSTSNAPTLTFLQCKMEASGERMMEETSCAGAYEGLLEAMMMASKKRASDEAVESGNARV